MESTQLIWGKGQEALKKLEDLLLPHLGAGDGGQWGKGSKAVSDGDKSIMRKNVIGAATRPYRAEKGSLGPAVVQVLSWGNTSSKLH